MTPKNLRTPVLVSAVAICFALLLALLVIIRSDGDYTNNTAALQIASESGFVQVALRQKMILYTVSEGDTLEGIARIFGVSVEAMREANGPRVQLVSVGQEIQIPPNGTK